MTGTGEKSQGQERQAILIRIKDLYVQGARSMRLGKTLWKIIGIKLFIIFFVFKLFFFPDLFQKYFTSDSQRAEHVINVLTDIPSVPLKVSKTNIDRR